MRKLKTRDSSFVGYHPRMKACSVADKSEKSNKGTVDVHGAMKNNQKSVPVLGTKGKSSVLPIFKDENCHSFNCWLVGINKYFEGKSLTEFEKFKTAVSCLRGLVLLWYQNLKLSRSINGKKTITSWSRLKFHMREKYIPSGEMPELRSKSKNDKTRLELLPEIDEHPNPNPAPFNHKPNHELAGDCIVAVSTSLQQPEADHNPTPCVETTPTQPEPQLQKPYLSTTEPKPETELPTTHSFLTCETETQIPFLATTETDPTHLNPTNQDYKPSQIPNPLTMKFPGPSNLSKVDLTATQPNLAHLTPGFRTQNPFLNPNMNPARAILNLQLVECLSQKNQPILSHSTEIPECTTKTESGKSSYFLPYLKTPSAPFPCKPDPSSETRKVKDENPSLYTPHFHYQMLTWLRKSLTSMDSYLPSLTLERDILRLKRQTVVWPVKVFSNECLSLLGPTCPEIVELGEEFATSEMHNLKQFMWMSYQNSSLNLIMGNGSCMNAILLKVGKMYGESLADFSAISWQFQSVFSVHTYAIMGMTERNEASVIKLETGLILRTRDPIMVFDPGGRKWNQHLESEMRIPAMIKNGKEFFFPSSKFEVKFFSTWGGCSRS